MKMMCTFSLLTLVSTVLLISCTPTAPPKPVDTPEKKSESTEVYKREIEIIGQVSSVNKDENFVLIKLSNPDAAAKHSIYHIENKKRSASLTPTGEKVSNTLAADITSGEPEVGDIVVAILSLSDQQGSGRLTPLSSPSPFLDELPDLSETSIPDEATPTDRTTTEEAPPAE